MNSKGIVLFFSLATFLCVGSKLKAQNIWQIDTVIGEGYHEIRTDLFTAYTFQFSDKTKSFPKVYMDGKYQDIKLDEHVQKPSLVQSVLYVQQDSVLRIRNQENLEMHIIFQNVPSLNSLPAKKAQFRTSCNAPQMISPSVWRAGLTDPAPNPSSTSMRHCIVHHSAGGNGNTNYTSLVRNYYTQHTQVNGWDDIGYNFLIGFDGSIYIGRDKQNLTVLQYRVQGAHFCGKNAGTSGICMIGDFDAILPSDTMLGSLKELLSWVFFEEIRIATDSTPHPTPTDLELDHIAGHRQGCATACPGDNVFSALDSIRAQVETKRLACQQFVSVLEENPTNTNFKLIDRKLTVKQGLSFTIYNSLGKVVLKNKLTQASLHYLNTGVYILHLSDGSKTKIYLR